MANPVVPSRNVRWGLDKFFTLFPKWTVWGGKTEIADRNTRYDHLTSELIDAILDLSPRSTFTVTTEVFRPDLISYSIYRSTDYWQIILMYNGIVDVGNLVAGTVLRYPGLQELESILLRYLAKKLPAEEIALAEEATVVYGGETPLHNDHNLRFGSYKSKGGTIKLSGNR